MHNIEPEDSVSNCSRISSRSKASRVSSRSRVSSLQIQVDRLEEIQRIEEREFKLNQKMQEEKFKLNQEKIKIDAEMRLRAAIAEEQIWAEENCGNSIYSNGGRKYETISHAGSTKSNKSSRQNKEFVRNRESSNNREYMEQPKMNYVNSDALQELVSHNIKTHLPKLEIEVFTGKWEKYQRFIETFDSLIDKSVVSYGEKLNYLYQYTGGEAREVVEACLYMDKEEGYKEARRQLKEEYGDPDIMATAYLDRICNWPHIEDDEALKRYCRMLQATRNALSGTTYGRAELDHPRNMRSVLEKLTKEQREGWRNYRERMSDSDINFKAGFDDIIKYIRREVKKRLDPIFGCDKFSADRVEKRNKGKALNREHCYATVDDNAETPPGNSRYPFCIHCKGAHWIDECALIMKMSYKERLEVIRSKGICFSCCRKGHFTKDCTRKLSCKICSKKHLTVLHMNEEEWRKQTDTRELEKTENIVQKTTSPTERAEFNCSLNSSEAASTKLRMCILPVKIKTELGKVVSTYAFLDTGSSASFITEDLIKLLAVPESNITRRNIALASVHGEQTNYHKVIAGLSVSSMLGGSEVLLPPVYSLEKIPVSEDDIVKKEDISKWSHLDQIDLVDIKNPPGLLLGMNVPSAMEPLEVIKSNEEGSPYAVKTRLGWCIFGIQGSNPHAVRINRMATKLEDINHDPVDPKVTNKQKEDGYENSELNIRECEELKDDNIYLNENSEKIKKQKPNKEIKMRDQTKKLQCQDETENVEDQVEEPEDGEENEKDKQDHEEDVDENSFLVGKFKNIYKYSERGRRLSDSIEGYTIPISQIVEKCEPFDDTDESVMKIEEVNKSKDGLVRSTLIQFE